MKIIQTVALFGFLTMVFASCTTMRYEKFDDGLHQDDDPWTEEEIVLKEQLWSDAAIVETFDDVEIQNIFNEFPGRMEKEIIDGVLHVRKIGGSDGLFRIGSRETDYEKIVICLRSRGVVYLSSHTSEGGDFSYDIEPAIFLNPSSTSVTNYTQDESDGEYSSKGLYYSDYGKISSWTVVEFHNSENGLRISMNGDHLATADIDGRPFPGIWFHLGEGNDKTEIDYILAK